MTFSLSLSVAQIQQLAEYADALDADTVVDITVTTEEITEGTDVWPAGLYAGVAGDPDAGCIHLDGDLNDNADYEEEDEDAPGA